VILYLSQRESLRFLDYPMKEILSEQSEYLKCLADGNSIGE